nr:hypothetical protein [uncultured Ruminococcus sp.]
MKKRLIPIILILALLMGLSLTACGNKDNGAAPDSASADQSATADSREASSAAAQAASSANKDDADDKSEAPASSKASGADAAAPQQENAQNNDDNAVEEENAPAPEKQEQSTPKKSSGSQSASSVSPNPAYDDDHRPQFTIVMTDKSSKKEYSAACSYTTDKENEAYASFFLPAGNYDIAVYEYADKIDKDHPLAESAYHNDKATKRKSIRVYYTPKDNKIEVKESASSRTQ